MPLPHAARLNELLDVVKREFEALSADASGWKDQRDEMEAKISQQIHETALLRQGLYELEAQHLKIRQEYEAEITHLRLELDARGPVPSLVKGSDAGGAPVLPPPAGGLGHNAGGRVTPVIGSPATGHQTQRQYPPISSSSSAPPPPPSSQPSSTAASSSKQPENTLPPLPSARPGGASTPQPGQPGARGASQPPAAGIHSPSLGPTRPVVASPQFGANPPPPPSAAAPAANSAAAAAAGSRSTPQPQARPTQQQQQQQQQQLTIQQREQQMTVVSDIEPDATSRELKKEGNDWLVAWSPTAKKVLDVNLVHTLVHESVVCCVKFSNDGHFLATGCNKTVQVFDSQTGNKICVLQDDSTSYPGDLYIRTLCFSPDGKYLATGAEDRQIRIWDISKRRIRHLLQGHGQEIYSLDFSADGRHLVSGSGDKSARIWDIETGSCIFDLKVDDFVMGENGPADAGLTSVAVSPDGRTVAAGSLDAVVRVWDAQTGKQLARLAGHSDSVYSVAFAPDGQYLCSGSLDRTLRVWDLSPPRPTPPPTSSSAIPPPLPSGEPGTGLYGACTKIVAGHQDYVLSVAVAHDGRWVVSGSKDRTVLFFEVATGQMQFMLQGHKNSVISVDLSKTQGMLATGSGDLNARIWSYWPVRE